MSGMSAMEKMVANMLGITPEKMAEMLNGFSTLATTLKEQLDRVEMGLETAIAKLDAIEAKMETADEKANLMLGNDVASLENDGELLARMKGLENVGSIGNNNRRRGNAGGSPGNGDGGQRDGGAGDDGRRPAGNDPH